VTLAGILNVNKPKGWSSFDVVALVRRLVREATGDRRCRVGHAGTLDPAAEGVLPVCLGQATRVAEYLVEEPKTYRAAVRLGICTDTYDAWGSVTATADPSGVSREQAAEALRGFVGEVWQVPPMYSAVKREGVPLYRYARAGQEVERQPRRVVIGRLELLAFEPPLLYIEVECGRGAYIRALAHDLGERLGCGAHLDYLRRTRIGPFRLEEAVHPDALRQAFGDGRWTDLVHPPDAALLQWPAAIIGERNERWSRMGRSLDLPLTPAARRRRLTPGMGCRAYSLDGYFVAILRYEGRDSLWRPDKVFSAVKDGEGS
jgi:tRNA pseudouridine55 synthase